MSDRQVYEIQLLSKDLEQLELDQRMLEKPLKELQNKYNVEVEKLDADQKQEWSALPEKVATAQETINFNINRLAAESKKLDLENNNLLEINNHILELKKSFEVEKSKPEIDQEQLSRISGQIAQLESEKNTSETNIINIKKKQKKIEDKLSEAQAEFSRYEDEKNIQFKTVNTAYIAVKSEEERIASENLKLSDRGNELVKKLNENVDLQEKPVFLNIKVVEDMIQVDLSWKIHLDCSDCETKFSLENNNIKNIFYQEEGGLLKFDLIDLRGIYSFRLVRSKDDGATNRINYNGDLTVKNSDGSVRYGVLKFVDGKF
jgi:chromosome segregation ATPase